MTEPARTSFAVLMPVEPERHSIAPGSAVVVTAADWEAFQADPKRYPVAYYEGGLYQRMSFAEKCLHAAGRCSARYPTVACCAILDRHEFKVIGAYDLPTKRLTGLTDEALEYWVDAR